MSRRKRKERAHHSETKTVASPKHDSGLVFLDETDQARLQNAVNGAVNGKTLKQETGISDTHRLYVIAKTGQAKPHEANSIKTGLDALGIQAPIVA